MPERHQCTCDSMSISQAIEDGSDVVAAELKKIRRLLEEQNALIRWSKSNAHSGVPFPGDQMHKR